MKAQHRIALAVTLALIVLGSIACGGGNSTPAKAVQTAFSAVKNKDVKAFKSVIPKKSLDQMEQAAKAQGKSVDDTIKQMFEFMDKDEIAKIPDKVETQNENISGDTATIEVKDAKGQWQKVNLVKEDDGWKLAKGL